ncbi:MAG TPA: hypothetical protein VMV56_12050 [Williamwhitmania sp.]|nr:hypothetical protein [Williamwhitmania sp.]
MKNNIKSKLIFLFLATTIFASCQSNSGKQAEERVKKFFVEYEQVGADKAIDDLYAENRWTKTADSAISNLKSQLDLVLKQVGKYNGYELIAQKKAGTCYLQLSYFVKYDRMPIRFTFQFYKPKDVWVITNFKYDLDVSEEMDKTTTLYFLDLEK